MTFFLGQIFGFCLHAQCHPGMTKKDLSQCLQQDGIKSSWDEPTCILNEPFPSQNHVTGCLHDSM